MGKLENFLIISKRGDAYLVHQSNTTDIYSTYVPRCISKLIKIITFTSFSFWFFAVTAYFCLGQNSASLNFFSARPCYIVS